MKKTHVIRNLVAALFLSLLVVGCGSVPENNSKSGRGEPKKLTVMDEKIDDDKLEIEFGVYPQSLKSPKVKVSHEPDDSGYYTGNDGFYYAKVEKATPKPAITFSDDVTPIEEGKTYYFKVEPVKWTVIHKSETGEKILLSKNILDTGNLAAAEIFLTSMGERAFSDKEKAKIIKNNDGKNVYFLSLDEVKNGGYTLTSDGVNILSAMTSDYARARGTYVSKMTRYEGKGFWWLSSQAANFPEKQDYISYYGRTGSVVSKDDAAMGILPAIRIKK